MCGFAGISDPGRGVSVPRSVIETMTNSLLHRGPDSTGYYYHPQLHLGHSRLSIIDLAAGDQPMANEDETIYIVFNGEIFNHVELRAGLIKRGHVFRTHSDTEVLVHLYEDHGTDMCGYLNGQFAFAIWDSKKGKIILARDRVGILPLFYSMINRSLIFGSEVKALFKYPGITKEFDPQGLHEIFTLWSTVPPATIFRNVREIPPGYVATYDSSGMKMNQYWSITFPLRNEHVNLPREVLILQLREHLERSVNLRLRSDVPVGTYLSGGLDSTITTAIARRQIPDVLHTFSLRFYDTAYDEGHMQEIAANDFNTIHHIRQVSIDDITGIYERMINHTEKPVWRSAPGPMLLLSSLVRENNIKVILTGEGADEILGGYNIFKENAIRRFWARDPVSHLRPQLIRSLYKYIDRDDRTWRFWLQFFGKNLQDTENPLYSHSIRWGNSTGMTHVYNRDFFCNVGMQSPLMKVLDELPGTFDRWHPLSQAQYLEMKYFLPGYLLSSQGERMTMGNSVEGRYPFLDHELIEWASMIDPVHKLYGLNEKFILKKAYEKDIPDRIIHRPKQPYRAPSPVASFLQNDRMMDYLSTDRVKDAGVFDPDAVEMFAKRLKRNPGEISARDDMIFNHLVSTMMVHEQFIRG